MTGVRADGSKMNTTTIWTVCLVPTLSRAPAYLGVPHERAMQSRDEKTALFFFDPMGGQPERVDTPRREGVICLACSSLRPLLVLLCPTGEVYFREEVSWLKAFMYRECVSGMLLVFGFRVGFGVDVLLSQCSCCSLLYIFLVLSTWEKIA